MFNKIKFAKILNNINDKYDTMTEFAKRSSVNRTYLSQYINQKLDAPPSPKVLMRIANSSQNITTYEELMETCGFLIKDVNKNLDEIRAAENTLKYENMIKKLSLSEKEESIVNKINSSFDEFNENNSITDSEKKSLKICLKGQNKCLLTIWNILALFVQKKSKRLKQVLLIQLEHLKQPAKLRLHVLVLRMN